MAGPRALQQEPLQSCSVFPLRGVIPAVSRTRPSIIHPREPPRSQSLPDSPDGSDGRTRLSTGQGFIPAFSTHHNNCTIPCGKKPWRTVRGESSHSSGGHRGHVPIYTPTRPTGASTLHNPYQTQYRNSTAAPWGPLAYFRN